MRNRYRKLAAVALPATLALLAATTGPAASRSSHNAVATITTGALIVDTSVNGGPVLEVDTDSQIDDPVCVAPGEVDIQLTVSDSGVGTPDANADIEVHDVQSSLILVENPASAGDDYYLVEVGLSPVLSGPWGGQVRGHNIDLDIGLRVIVHSLTTPYPEDPEDPCIPDEVECVVDAFAHQGFLSNGLEGTSTGDWDAAGSPPDPVVGATLSTQTGAPALAAVGQCDDPVLNGWFGGGAGGQLVPVEAAFTLDIIGA